MLQTKRILAVLALITAATTLFAADEIRCTGSPHECEQQIREMLAGRRYLGVKLTETRWGLEVQSVVPESPAARAGLRVGDRILAVNGKDCSRAKVKDFKKIMNDAKAAGKVTIAVVRAGAITWVYANIDALSKEQIDKIVAAHLRDAHGVVETSN